MRQFFRRLAHKTGLLHAPSDPARSATRPLRVLLVGSIVFPVVLYAVAAAISYHQHFDDARDRLHRNLAIVHEHAQKVFETFEFASRYLDEITADVTDEQIRRQRGDPIPSGCNAMTTSLPQLRDLWIVGADGYPLVSGTVFPMPRIDLSDRNYFKAHRDNPAWTALRQPGAGGARRQHPLLCDQPQARRSTADSPASPSFRSRRNISPTSIRNCRRPAPRRCCAPTARCWPAIRTSRRRRRSCRSDAPFMTAIQTRPTAGFVTAAVRDRRPHAHFHLPAAGEAAHLYVAVGVDRPPSSAPGCSPWRAI